MRKTALILAFAIALPVWAQEKPAEPAAPEKAAPVAPQESEKTETPKKRTAKGHSRRTEDARHCLDKSTNTEIIKCAEAYL